MISNFKTYYKAMSINTVCHWHKDSQRNRKNRKVTEGEGYIHGWFMIVAPNEFSKDKKVFLTNGTMIIG